MCTCVYVREQAREREKSDPELAFMTQAHSPRMRSAQKHARTHTHTLRLMDIDPGDGD